MDVEAFLAAVRAVVREEIGAAARPSAVSFQRAAQLMECSPKHVSRMVRAGQVLVVDIAGLRRIPMSEIDRLTSATKPMASSGATPERTKFDGQAALARLAELRRGRR